MIGRPIHLLSRMSAVPWTACGVQSDLVSTSWRGVNCARCRKTRAWRRNRADVRRQEIADFVFMGRQT